MKKKIAIVMIVCLCLSLLGGCTAAGQTKGENEKLKIVCTIYPIYDWVNQIIGEDSQNTEVKLLMSNGADLHSFQPSVEDIVSIQDCDLFIYVGGTSDVWVENVLNDKKGTSVTAISLMDVLGERIREEELVEGMEGEEEEEGPEYDEHVWLSLSNAKIICEEISKQLTTLDETNSDKYAANATAYTAQLTTLDEQFRECVQNARLHSLIFGDRFPFRYLTEDYDLEYYAAFIGCSAETEASFATVTFLAQKADEIGTKSIVVLENSNQKIANTIIENAESEDLQIIVMNSLQSVSIDDMDEDVSYLSIMEQNCEALSKALQ